MKTSRSTPMPRVQGFTLVELLAAITILTLVVVISGSMTLSVLSGSSSVQKRAESDTEGRGFMARIAYDLQTVVHNQNVPLLAIPSGTNGVNPSIGFVCASRNASVVLGGSTVVPRLSAVYYQIGTPASDTQLALLRGCGPIFWDSTGTPSDPTTALGLIAGAMNGGTAAGFSVAPDVVPIGAGIIRMTYVLTLTNGSSVPLGSVPSSTQLSGFSSNKALPATYAGIASDFVAVDLSQVRAITVGIAVLNTGTQRTLSSTQLQNLVNAIPEPQVVGGVGQKPLDVWSVQQSSIQSVLKNVSVLVGMNLRFYQQTILVP